MKSAFATPADAAIKDGRLGCQVRRCCVRHAPWITLAVALVAALTVGASAARADVPWCPQTSALAQGGGISVVVTCSDTGAVQSFQSPYDAHDATSGFGGIRVIAYGAKGGAGGCDGPLASNGTCTVGGGGLGAEVSAYVPAINSDMYQVIVGGAGQAGYTDPTTGGAYGGSGGYNGGGSGGTDIYDDQTFQGAGGGGASEFDGPGPSYTAADRLVVRAGEAATEATLRRAKPRAVTPARRVLTASPRTTPGMKRRDSCTGAAMAPPRARREPLPAREHLTVPSMGRGAKTASPGPVATVPTAGTLSISTSPAVEAAADTSVAAPESRMSAAPAAAAAAQVSAPTILRAIRRPTRRAPRTVTARS